MLGNFHRGDLVFHAPTKRFGTVVKSPKKNSEYIVVNFKHVEEKKPLTDYYGYGYRTNKTRTSAWFRLIALTQAEAIKFSEIESPAHGTICSSKIKKMTKITDKITF